MQKGTIKAIVLPVVFVLAVIIFSFMTNQTNEDLTTEMSEATLPVLTLCSLYARYDHADRGRQTSSGDGENLSDRSG